MLSKTVNGILAGIMISIGGSVFLACENRYVGAFFFSVALLTICIKGYSLYTGKIGFIVEKHGKEEFSVLLLGLLGNAIATIICGMLLKYAVPNYVDAALAICTKKLAQSFLQTLIRASFCGILMYIAVSIYKDGKNVIGILFAIPVFILSGFEHSIANMFYFAASGIVSLEAFGYLWTVILGNTIGAMLFPALLLLGDNKKNKEATDEMLAKNKA